MATIKIKIFRGDKEYESSVDGEIVGKLAVHHNDAGKGEGYAITSLHHGLKMPGWVWNRKVALACAKELNDLFDWEEFDVKNEEHKKYAVEAKGILEEWGFY